MQSVTSILLVTKSRNRLAEDAAAEIGQWLESRGVSRTTLSADCRQETLLAAARSAQAAVILGGDGTFVGISRKLTVLESLFWASISDRSVFWPSWPTQTGNPFLKNSLPENFGYVRVPYLYGRSSMRGGQSARDTQPTTSSWGAEPWPAFFRCRFP